ncbi:MAG: glycoside hydrolase family 26 protein [Muribaculaceae bacterium]|nr:glycoside hydrolase family 26 protein [Muribaculaceae bacterium]
MKKIILSAACVFVLSSCVHAQKSTESEDPTATPAAALMERLHKAVADSAVYFGHHDDTAYGHEWRYAEGRSDVLETAGKYPGLINWDLGLIEYGKAAELDGVPFDFIRQEVRKQNARGGINSFSWHARNPANGRTAWDTNDSPLAEGTVEGTALNDTLKAWIGRAADFMLSLTDENGKRIPVLFRPWHEHTGSWFWWGKDICTPEQYKALWYMTRRVFDERGVDNVVWVYSPDRIQTIEEYAERYPGDEYVDVLGADAYHFGGEQGTDEFNARVRLQLDAAKALSEKNGKIIALSETGCESIAMPDWYSRVLMPVLNEYPVAFVCVWRNANQNENPRHFYVPYKGHPAEEDFHKFANDPKILMAE